MTRNQLLKVIGGGLAALLIGVQPANAAHSNIDFVGVNSLDSTCRYSNLAFVFFMHGATDDGIGDDYFAFTTTDANGVPLDAGGTDVIFGGTEYEFYGSSVGWLNAPTSAIVYLRMWDVDLNLLDGAQSSYNYAEANGTLVDSAIIDLNAVDSGALAGVCGNLPYPPPVGVCTVDDGRINDESCAGPVALYCTDNALEVWAIDADGAGSLAFTFSGSFETPATNTLLKKVGDIELWQLDTGEFQVNADAGEGKTYAFVFNGCPYDGNGYNVNLDPNDASND